jgi:hypothetical protein
MANDTKAFDSVRIVHIRVDRKTIGVERNVLDRLVQEEIWTQTLWPDGVPALAQVVELFDGLDDVDQATFFDMIAGLRRRFIKRGK